MAKNTLPVDFKDDIMNSSMGGKRRYRMINNSDGTISLEDVTKYDQVGSNFGASQMNATNEAVNAAADAGKIIDDLDAINNVTQEGYIAGAIALKQVNSNLNNHDVEVIANIRKGVTTTQTIDVPNLSQYKEILLCIRSDGDTEEGMFIYGIETIPYKLFKKGIDILCRRYIGNDIYANIKYLSDTSIAMSTHSAFGAIAYGVK